jgi:hypothetical protein
MAGSSVTTGANNFAAGAEALKTVTTTGNNTACGTKALELATGANNAAFGNSAAGNLVGGNSNVAIGNIAGSNWNASESNNVCIGNSGTAGVSSRINIGVQGTQTTNFTAGIRGVTTTAADAVAVLISSTGQLGTTSSLRELKENIIAVDPEQNHAVLEALNVYYFNYKSNPCKTRTVGMMIDEVAPISELLTARDADRKIETVKYHLLPNLLLVEQQRSNKIIAALEKRIADLEAKIINVNVGL